MTRNQEPPGSSSSFTFEENNQELMTSREVHHQLLHLRKKPRNDDEPPGLLSSSTLEEKNQKTFVAFLVLFLHFSTVEESQINVNCCGYIVGCLQQPSRLIGRALNDLHEQESILLSI
jgi:hypothetical protein